MPAHHQPDLPSSTSLPLLSAHRCFLFYPLRPCQYPPPQSSSLGQLADAQRQLARGSSTPWLSSALLSSITPERRQRPVWIPKPLPVGSDLHPHIQRLLGGKPYDKLPGDEQHAITYRRSDETHKLLNGTPLGNPPQTAPRTPQQPPQANPLTLTLSKAAQRRIARHLPEFAQPDLQVNIEDLQQTIFRTGHGLLIAEISFGVPDQPLHPSVLLEGLCALCRFNKLKHQTGEHNNAVSDTPSPPADQQQTGVPLGQIIRSLSCVDSETHPATRVYSASYLQFEQSPPDAELDQLLTRIARHYTDDYQLPAANSHTVSVAHFDNVRHRFALEGCATAIDLGSYPAEQRPNALQDYFTTTYRQHYLPIILLSYHEFCFLLHLTNDASFWPQPDDEPAAIAHMQAIREPVTAFTLCFRFSFVSRIGMHNDVNQGLRRVLGLDTMLEELHQDSARIDRFLSEVATRKQQQQASQRDHFYHLIAVPGIAVVTWLSLFSGLKDVFAIPSIVEFLNISADQAPLCALLTSLPLGLLAGFYVYLRGRPAKQDP